MRRAFIGVGAATVDVPRRIALRLDLARKTGAAITSLEQGGPADVAGLSTGDLILSLDGRPVSNVNELTRALDSALIGRVVVMEVLRRSDLRRFWIGPSERKA